MNRLILAILMVASTSTFAGSVAVSSSTAAAAANNSYNAGNNNVTQNYAGTVIPDKVTIRNTADASGPALTTSSDTCMGSSSAGGSGPGFSLSIGSTWTDKDCQRRLNSRAAWNYGSPGVAWALLCQNADVKQAAKDAGSTACDSVAPQARAEQPKPQAAANSPEVDPFHTARK